MYACVTVYMHLSLTHFYSHWSIDSSEIIFFLCSSLMKRINKNRNQDINNKRYSDYVTLNYTYLLTSELYFSIKALDTKISKYMFGLTNTYFYSYKL